MKMAEIIEVGKRYTKVKFFKTIYYMGRIKYEAGFEYLIPNHEVKQYTYTGDSDCCEEKER